MALMFLFLSIEVDNEEFNTQFWNRLQDEWKKISDKMDDQSPWLSEFSEYYDPYKVGFDILFILELYHITLDFAVLKLGFAHEHN